ncbi:MAG: fimbria major subunit, partial [Muribaculaceae bacterium]|nr:fimbria major subunit [Muribaculaceae bacterium]
FLLGSCSSDAPIGGAPNIPEEGDGYFLKVEFNNFKTRAEGDTKIDNVAFLFYDQDDNYITTRYISTEEGGRTDSNIEWAPADHSGKKCAVIQLTTTPKYVACVVNSGSTNITDSKNDDATNLDKRTVSNKTKDGTDNLYMSSVTKYLGDNNSRSYKAQITNAMIHTDKTVAQSASGAQALVIDVEPVVAKVEVTRDGAWKADAKAKGQFETDLKVEFSPEIVCLTGYNSAGYTMKRLPKYSDITDDVLLAWDDLVNDNGSSGWVGETAGNISYYSLNDMCNADKTLKDNVKYAASFNAATFYPFENRSSAEVDKTNLVVVGKYTLKDKDNKVINNSNNGTFYLLGVGDKFTVYTDLEKLITDMGGNPATDKLVEECGSGTDHKTWTGWMKLDKTSSAFRCIKYNGGYGYYAHKIMRIEDKGKAAIVRNTHYKLNMKEIQGMGVGLPTDDTKIIPTPSPDPSKKTYYMHIAVDVQPWVELDSYDVIWK